MDLACPKCSGTPVAVETATVHLDREPRQAELALRCGCGVRWTARELTVDTAIEGCRMAIVGNHWLGATHSALAMLLEVGGKSDEAYEEHGTALRCTDELDRAFSHERRGAYEARQGWLRNALSSFRRALASGGRDATSREAIAFLERELAARGIEFPPADRERGVAWLRACELELPPGLGARNELGQPLAEDVIEIERLIRAERWDDAVAALRALAMVDANKFFDATGYARRGAELARSAGRRDAALALQALVIQAHVMWASWSTSGAEGMGRTADVELERERLRAWERE